MWDDQQSLHRELSCMSARKIFLAVELLLWVEASYSHTAARYQLNCKGSKPHSRMTHQEGVVSLTISILLSTVISYFGKRLSISLPCRKNGVAQAWLACIPAGIAYVLRSRMQSCNLFVRFVCYNTRADTAMSLRQARQKSWKTLGKGELPEKPTS